MLKISCALGTYGDNSDLSEVISCFLDQDYPNKELIVVNQHPQALSYNHPEIKVLNKTAEELNTLPKIRQCCIDNCSGQIIKLLDNDDIFLPWHLSDYTANLLASGKKAVAGKMMVVSYNNSLYTIQSNLVSNPNCIFKQEFIPTQDIELYNKAIDHPVFHDLKSRYTEVLNYRPRAGIVSYVRRFKYSPYQLSSTAITECRKNANDLSTLVRLNMYDLRWNNLLTKLKFVLSEVNYSEIERKIKSYYV